MSAQADIARMLAYESFYGGVVWRNYFRSARVVGFSN